MRLTAQVQPNKSSSKQDSRPTRDFDCVFGVYAFLMFLVTDSQADHFFLCFSGFLVTDSPTDRCFLFFGCFLVTGSQADRCFYCCRWFWLPAAQPIGVSDVFNDFW